MAKEWILNNVMNRFQLNYKKNVGSTSASIRKCKPNNMADWAKYYYGKVRSKRHINKLGKILFLKIKNDMKKELASITKKDCINYLHNLVINRTFDGYMTEIEIVKNSLEKKLRISIKQAPDKWDRLFGVDFYIPVNKYYIGIQIKPENLGVTLQVFARYGLFLKAQHDKFTKKYGGKCFVVYSIKKNDEKIIQNKEVVKRIKDEIKRLKYKK